MKLVEQKSKPAVFSECYKRKFLQLVEIKPVPNKENDEKNPAVRIRKYLIEYKIPTLEGKSQTAREQKNELLLISESKV